VNLLLIEYNAGPKTLKNNEPVMRVSNDNGKTFGERIMLSNSETTAKPLL
jgi:hypothetical protein